MIEYLKELFTHYPYGVKATIRKRHTAEYEQNRTIRCVKYCAQIYTSVTFWNKLFCDANYYSLDHKYFDFTDEGLEEAKNWATMRYDECVDDLMKKQQNKMSKTIWKIPPG